MNGRLGDVLRSYVDAGFKAEEITYRLRDEHNIRISRSTTYRWLELLAKERAS